MENSGGEGGLAILEFGGQGGDKHFGISEGKWGGKILMPPVVGYGYFLESPNISKPLKHTCSIVKRILVFKW